MTTAPTRFRPLELALIDEGRFLDQANADLLDLEARLIEFRREHGEKAQGARAKLTIEVSLAAEKGEAFSIKASTRSTLPARPASVTMAMDGVSQDEKDCLFVRASGSTARPPQQQVLTTQDGRIVDPSTGEPTA